jgi:cyclomaltodextrinase / maltogenic alpha-amylase / neopullulanase
MRKSFSSSSSILLTFILLSVSQSLNYQIYGQDKLVHPEWSKNLVIYEANVRQYTPEGTFKAFEKKLPELKKMGIGIIWLMPINPIGILNRKGTLGSYYSIKNYKEVNSEFGTKDNFRHLVKKIHAMKMYVIIDWVANHTAWDNVWVKTHPDFYTKDAQGKFVPPVADWADVIDLNYDNKELRDSMYCAMEYWVKQFDIDGFRCDVADMVPTDFWIGVRKKLDPVKKVFMLAEADKNYIHQAFDMTYNWPLKDLMNDIVKGKKNAVDIKKYFENEKKEFDPSDYRMVFTTNHDENSWNGTEYERLGAGAETFAVFCGTVKGMPLIYNGQEVSMNKRLRFFDKDTIDWKSSSLREFYTKLNLLKEKNKALWNGASGSEMQFIETGNDNALAFVRQKNKNKVFAIFNLSAEKQVVKLKDNLIAGEYSNLFDNGRKIKLNEDAEFQLDPWSYKVYSK